MIIITTKMVVLRPSSHTSSFAIPLSGVEEHDFILGGGAQRRLRTDHVAMVRGRVQEGDVPPPTQSAEAILIVSNAHAR